MFENITYRLFRLFLRIYVIILDPVFKASFPTAFAPECSMGLTKRKSPLKKTLCHYPPAP